MREAEAFGLTFSHVCDGGVACVAATRGEPAALVAVGTHSAPVSVVALHLQQDGDDNGRVAQLQAAPGGSSALCFSPDGKQLFTGGADGSLRRWDACISSGSSSELLLEQQPGEPASPVAGLCPGGKDGSLAAACGRCAAAPWGPSPPPAAAAKALGFF